MAPTPEVQDHGIATTSLPHGLRELNHAPDALSRNPASDPQTSDLLAENTTTDMCRNQSTHYQHTREPKTDRPLPTN